MTERNIRTRSNEVYVVRGVIASALDDLAAVSQAASRLEKECRNLLYRRSAKPAAGTRKNAGRHMNKLEADMRGTNLNMRSIWFGEYFIRWTI